jgi:hypothetical protein
MNFPQPTSIPILDKQMDVGFNQTEIHMSDPTTRNIELRPDAWRDPNEPASISEQHTHVQTSDADINLGFDANAPGIQDDPSGLLLPQSDDATQVSATTDAVITAENVQSHAPETGISSEIPADAMTGIELQPDDVHAEQSLSASASDDTHVQSLLDNLQTSLVPESTETALADAHDLLQTAHTSSSTVPAAGTDTSHIVDDDQRVVSSAAAALPSGLPPRPPPQEQPLIHPNYVHSQHIRDYHPHAVQSQSRNDNAEPTTEPTSPSANQSAHASSVSRGSPSTKQQPSSPTVARTAAEYAARQASARSSATPLESRRETKLAAGEVPGVDDRPWDADIQRKYDQFLEQERKYVNEARWDQFPAGSRLFVGNLSSEKVTKRDIFHVFHTYGELAQISIKQAYGFVQFLRVDDCIRAMEGEQGRQIREKRIHLEVSKPQKSKAPQQQNAGRRSRSPEQSGRGRQNSDRHGRNSNTRSRDDYRPAQRSPSPRNYRDRYDDRYRARSRSPGYGRNDRYGSRASPPRADDDDLPLPRRSPADVPDVQIIVQTELSRDFIAWVEQSFTARGVRVGTLRLAPRLNEDAVVKRQILEGVLAVVKLKRANQDSSKIGLTIFKRKPGMRDVQFEDYDNLDPPICVELVLREKQTHLASSGGYAGHYSAPSGGPQYGYQPPSNPAPVASYGYPQGYPPPSGAFPGQGAAHLQNLNTNNLQSLITSLSQASPTTPHTAGAGGSMYGAVPPPAPPGSAGYPPPPNYGQYGGGAPPQDPYAAMRYPAHGANTMPPQHPGNAPAPPPNMQDILARLGTYGNR